MKERNLSFDLLRSIGLIGIILAHVKPPELLFQLRTFDVVMMVCVSTVSFTEYSKPKPYLQYLKGRVKRLLLPAWEYIALLGVIFYCVASITNTTTPFPLKTLIIGCVSLSGVGYLWIIRVFLYNAFINPFIPKLKSCNTGGVILGVIVLFVLYSFIRDFCMNSQIPHFATLAEASFLDFWAYGLIAVMAFILYHLDIKKLLYGIGVLAIVLAITIYLNGGFIPNTFKYPPSTQYVLWGLFVVGIAFLACRLFPVRHLPKVLTFISANSMWVYFWHLIPVNFIEHYNQFCPQIVVSTWWIKWILILVFATTMTFLQNNFLNSKIFKFSKD